MRKKLLALLCACAMIAALLPVYTAVMETPDVSTLYKKKDTATDYDASAVIKVELQGDTWSSLDQTLSQTGTTLTFQAGGEYLLTGTWNGQLAVECDKAEDVRLILAGGGLVPELVAWLSRAGVRAFQVGPQVRTGGSFAADVDPSLVRGWRILLDSEHVRRAS